MLTDSVQFYLKIFVQNGYALLANIMVASRVVANF